MNSKYEIVEYNDDLPVKVFMHASERIMLHWHKEMELILVVEGEVKVITNGSTTLLKEGDIALINANEIHSTEKTTINNLLVVVQIDLSNFERFDNDIYGYLFRVNQENKKNIQYIRECISNIMVEMAVKKDGYKFAVSNYLFSFFNYLIRNVNYEKIEVNECVVLDKDKERLARIIDFVNENYSKKISLKEIADREFLSFYYLSHFFKDKVGISFQQYLNNVRLKAAVEILLNTDKQLNEIIDLCGFSSTKLMSKLFKDEYGMTPGEFRKKNTTKDKNIRNGGQRNYYGYIPIYSPRDLSKVIGFCSTVIDKENENFKDLNKTVEKVVTIDNLNSEIKYDRYFNKIITFSRAVEGLRSDFQQQLIEVQRGLKFEYIRFHGIFNDEMMIYNIGEGESVIYNFSYVDKLFDFFLSINLKPFIELSCMPSELKSNDKTVFWWKGNISPPNDINAWCNLVEALLKHCINRYGYKEVSTWYIEIWNEPDFKDQFWTGTKEEYFELYNNTVASVKSICKELKVGGPAITGATVLDGKWLEEFLKKCKVRDFISYHVYSEILSNDFIINGMGSRHYLSETIEAAKRKIRDKVIEVNITEWNITCMNGNPINDSLFNATSIVRDVLENQNKINALAHWTFTDLYEEHKAGIKEFSGSFGLVSKNGIKKPAYWALSFLSKLEDYVIYQDEKCIVTKSDKGVISLLTYNHPNIDNAYDEELFERFAQDSYLIKISLNDTLGKNIIKRYKIDQNNGNISKEFRKLEVIDELTMEEIKYLKAKAMPQYTSEIVDVKGELDIESHVTCCGMELIIIEPIY